MCRAVTAGMFVGSYHFGRPDVLTNAFNPGDVANIAARVQARTRW